MASRLAGLVSGVEAAIRRLLRSRDPREEFRASVAALQSIRPVERRLPEIDDALRLPASELYASKSAAELRKLANHAFHGVGTDKDVAKASGLWAAGAMKGDLECTYSIAQCVLQGIGLAKDLYGGPNPDAALQILEGIVRQVPHSWSMFSIASILVDRHSANATDEDRRQLTRALELFVQAAKLNVPPACLNVSQLYERGLGVPKDEAKALEWLVQAARAGDPVAQIQLGRRYAEGDSSVGGTRDDTKAFRLYMLAAKTGRPTSLFNVGVAFLGGLGVDRDDAKAAQYFAEAASAGFMPAKVNLALLYEQGRGVPQDYATAERLLLEVAAAGFAEDVADSLDAVRRRRALTDAGLGTPVLGSTSPLAPTTAASEVTAAAAAAVGAPTASPSVVSSTRVASDGLVFESRLASGAEAAETLEIELDATSDPRAGEALLREAAARTSLRRDELLAWLRQRADETGVRIKRLGLVPATSDRR